MFDFFYDIFGEINKKNFRYQVDGGKKIAIQGYKNILLITENKVVIKLFDGELEVCGKDLKIKELSENTIIILGEIVSVFTEKSKWKTI